MFVEPMTEKIKLINNGKLKKYQYIFKSITVKIV